MITATSTFHYFSAASLPTPTAAVVRPGTAVLFCSYTASREADCQEGLIIKADESVVS